MSISLGNSNMRRVGGQPLLVDVHARRNKRRRNKLKSEYVVSVL